MALAEHRQTAAWRYLQEIRKAKGLKADGFQPHLFIKFLRRDISRPDIERHFIELKRFASLLHAQTTSLRCAAPLVLASTHRSSIKSEAADALMAHEQEILEANAIDMERGLREMHIEPTALNSSNKNTKVKYLR